MKELEYKGPRCDQAVDIAIFNFDGSKILLVRKPHQDKFRFPGGFSDVDSETLEDDAVRETLEETQLVVENPIYIGSRKVDDPRYQQTIHRVKTCLFAVYGYSGTAIPSDDLKGGECRWLDVEDFKTFPMMPEHAKLREMLIKKLGL